MIKYQLRCDADHEFEGWFRGSDDYEKQSADGFLECPVCGSETIQKAIMAPAISRKANASRAARLDEIRQSMGAAAKRARDYVEKNFDYVGGKFPEEARKIHYGETKSRGIYGEASGREVKELVDEGVQVASLPGSPSAKDKAGEPIAAAKDVKKPVN